MKTTIVVLVTGLALIGCQSSPETQQAGAEPHKLTVDELRAEMAVPHTAYTDGSYGPKTSVGYFADGKIKTRSPQNNDTGTYRITDDGLYRSTFTMLRAGIETCQTIYQVAEGRFESHLPNGTIVKSMTVPGNPEGL